MAISVLYRHGRGALFPAAFAHHGAYSPTPQLWQEDGPWAHEVREVIGTVRPIRRD